MDVVASASKISYGGREAISVIVHNITERKQVDERLRESEEKYRSLLENIPDVTWTTDEKGNTTFISANVESVYGFTSDELVNDDEQQWLGRIHPDDIAQVLEGYRSLFAERKPYDVEFRIQRKDGVWIWLRRSRQEILAKAAGRICEKVARAVKVPGARRVREIDEG